MSKETDQTSDKWISLTEAAELIAINIYPQESPRTARNKAYDLIRTAVKQGAFKRKHFAKQTYVSKEEFRHWAARKWSTFAESFDLPEYLWHARRAPANRIPRRLISIPLPVFDPNSVRIPGEFDRLKNRYLQAKQDLMITKWRLSNCQAELSALINRDDAMRRKKSEAGKKGGRGRTK